MEIKKKVIFNENLKKIISDLKKLKIKTICIEDSCPNIGECFNKNKVTFLILGNICTRNCIYCNVKKGKIGENLNYNEVDNIVKFINKYQLNHVIITSVTRDDLQDGGSDYFSKIAKRIKEYDKNIFLEMITPDFRYSNEAIEKILNSDADLLCHNIELVYSVYERFRPKGNYNNSLKLLKLYKKSGKFTKTSIMLGFGEKWNEIIKTVEDIAKSNVDFLSIGQYIPPSKNHFKPLKFYSDDEFNKLKNFIINNFSFKKVNISFYSRSSYLDV